MMTENICDYEVKCSTCRKVYTVQLFGSHEKNLFVVDKKDWYCEECKRAFLRKEADKHLNASQAIGFSELTGTDKTVTWAEKIRAELINKVKYLKDSLSFANGEDKALSDQAFDLFFQEWFEKAAAKWWIDNRRMTVRDISKRVEEIKKTLEADT
ncbi:MAG: hypothetical protein JEZ12_06485 [Desulfobacterium sp.]|nr:hypothetical protein [Desulfobacterium sp.]